MTILGIDTSNKALGVVLGEDEKVISSYYSQASKNHSETLMPAIDFCVKENKLSPKDLTKIIVAQGPGSYTGLRIGVTCAKTLSWTLNIPLYSVSSLACLAKNIQETDSLIIPFMDARRGFMYTGAYKYDHDRLVNVIDDQYISFADWVTQLEKYKENIIFIGEELGKLEEIMTEYVKQHEFKIVIKPSDPSVMLELDSLLNEVEDVDAFVPTYLKKVEAEEEWLKKQKNRIDSTESLVERLS